MNRTAQFLGKNKTRPVIKTLAAGLLLALAAMPAAHAGVIDFEGYSNTVVNNLETPFAQAGVLVGGLSIAPGAQAGDLVGLVVDGSDPGACAGLACPTGNSGSYFAGLNDGVLDLSTANAANHVQIKGFDASFIGATAGATYPARAGFLRVQGFYANGTTKYEDFNLLSGTNGFTFQHFNASTSFGAQQFSEVAIFAFSCKSSNDCSAFNSDKGQFAIDNVVVSVPEPTTYMMMLAGLIGIGALSRRRA
ncbi:hypothetical protein AAKU55_005195 [Oxalobacteraceae bacterium GrIS 1.11]